MNPAYHSGFASPQRGRMKYPGLWRGCVFAAAPCLGQTGLVLRDHSGYGNHGTLTNGPTWGPSAGKTALSFDGTNDYITTGKPASTFINQRAGTISLWYRPAGASPVVGAYYSGDGIIGGIPNAYFGLYRASIGGSDRIHAGVFDGGHKSIAASYVNEVWTHLIWMITATQLRLYKDGYLIGQSASTGPSVISDTFAIGVVATTYAEGMIDDVMTYKHPISESIVRQLATRRGIAYELAARRRSSILVPPFRAAWLNQRSQIIGGGVR